MQLIYIRILGSSSENNVSQQQPLDSLALIFPIHIDLSTSHVDDSDEDTQSNQHQHIHHFQRIVGDEDESRE